MKPIDVVNKWIEVAQYDLNQTKLDLLYPDHLFNTSIQYVDTLLEWDSSGVLAALYAKASFESASKNMSISLYDAIHSPNVLGKHIELQRMFECDEIIQAEQIFVSYISSLIEEGKKYTKNRDTISSDVDIDMLRSAIICVAEQITDLNINLFKRGDRVGSNDCVRARGRILVFNTVSQCILCAEKNFSDGLYLCYISDPNCKHFEYILKSNGTILSVNDRVDEKFIGQHAECENNRRDEQRAESIFPYSSMVDVSSSKEYFRYPEYAATHINQRSVVELGEQHLYTFVIYTYLILSRFCMQDLTELSLSYVHTLFNTEAGSEEELQSTLPAYANDSRIVEQHLNLYKDIAYRITDDFVVEDRGRVYLDTGDCSCCRHSALVDTFGQDFKVDRRNVLEHPDLRLYNGDETAQPEFVGSADDMLREYYRKCRLQLRNHITKKDEREIY